MGQERRGPGAGAKPKPVAVDGKLDAGPVEKIAQGFTDKYVKSDRVMIRRQGEEIVALFSKCTHKNCDVQAVAGKDDLYCHCHKSAFTGEGKVTHGPAKTSLAHYGVSVKDGHLIVFKRESA